MPNTQGGYPEAVVPREGREPWQNDDYAAQNDAWRGARAEDALLMAANVRPELGPGVDYPPEVVARVLRQAFPQVVQLLAQHGLMRTLSALQSRVSELESREQQRQAEEAERAVAEQQFAQELLELQGGCEAADAEWHVGYDLNALYENWE